MRIPTVGVDWHYIPPLILLKEWPDRARRADAPFTAVSHWYSGEWFADFDGSFYLNDKRSGYLPFFDLPKLTKQPLELAICIDSHEPDRADLSAAAGACGIRRK